MGNSKLLKVFFWVLVLVGVVGFLTVGAAENGARKLKNGASTAAGSMEHLEVGNTGRQKQHNRAFSKSDNLNYMSKRKVPNGPDPIHNRKAGQSSRPPGQA